VATQENNFYKDKRNKHVEKHYVFYSIFEGVLSGLSGQTGNCCYNMTGEISMTILQER